jgi:hypothetical protein
VSEWVSSEYSHGVGKPLTYGAGTSPQRNLPPQI